MPSGLSHDPWGLFFVLNYHNFILFFLGPVPNPGNEQIDGYEDMFYDYNNFYGGPCMEPPLVWDDECGSSR